MLPVDIVIPICGPATRRGIDSVLAARPQRPHEIVVVDDASADAELARFLRELARDGRITLLEEREPRGYTAAVNRAIALHADRDLLLLESEAVVANDWLDRLAYHAQRESRVGAVAPFCNRGGAANYPRLDADNASLEPAAVAALDRHFARANPQQSVTLPFVTGPCLYLRRDCLVAVGAFDASPLPSDRGVEIDFCLRAASAGFHHFVAGDVYVGHGGSALDGDRDKAAADKTDEALTALYPDYPGARAALRSRSPARPFARRVDLLRLADWPVPIIVFVSHGWGGGIRRHMSDLASFGRGRCEVLNLEPAAGDTVKLYWARAEEEFAAYFSLPQDLPKLAALMKSLRVARLHFHHVHQQPRAILDLPVVAELPYDVTLHDYYAICPQYHLVTSDGRYCGEPAAAACNACIAERPNRWGLDITTWRETFARLLAHADRVIAPSADVAQRVHRYLPDLPIAVWPHPEFELSSPPKVARVVVLGNLSREKGLRVVAACAADARARELPLTFRVLGSTTEPTAQSPDVPLSIVGQYDDAALPALLAAEKADVIFFPAQVPETYSYTLSVALASGLPIVVSSLGALPERVAGHDRATTLRWNATAVEWNAALLAAAGIGTGAPAQSESALPLAMTS